MLVPEPERWCAAHFDAALATLTEYSLATPRDVELISAFAEASDQPRTPFSDDWTAAEASDGPAPALAEGPGHDALTELLEVARALAPSQWLAVRAPTGVTVEVGCGIGRTSKLLKGKRVVADTSLRAVLLAAKRTGALPVVMNAEALSLRSKSVDAIIAENVIDLLDDPRAFLESAKRALTRSGRLLLSTPGPVLNSPDADDETLSRVAAQCGLEVVDGAKAVPWLRRNSSRFIEVWLADLFELRGAA